MKMNFDINFIINTINKNNLDINKKDKFVKIKFLKILNY